MRGDVFWEIVGGLSGAVVIPLLMSALWGTYWRAGAIAGVAFATLVHVTVAVGLVALGYQGAEALVNGKRRSPWVVGIAALVAAVVFVWQMDWSRLSG